MEISLRRQLCLVGFVLAAMAIVPGSPFRVTVAPLVYSLSKVLLGGPVEARVVVLALLGLSVWSILRLWAEWQRLTREERMLVSCREELQNRLLPLDGSELQQWLRGAPAESALIRAVQALWDARILQSPNIEAISGVLAGLEGTRANLGRTVSNRLMLLSLFGTVVGLAGVIATLQPQLAAAKNSGDVESLLSNLESTLLTMGTAFSSTAWGILLASLMAWLAGRVNDRRADYVAEVQHFIVAELAPPLLPVSQSSAADQMRHLVLESQQYLREHRQFLHDLRLESRNHLQDLVAENHKVVEVTKQLVIGVESSMTNATSGLHQALTEAGGYVVEGAKAQIEVARQLDALLGQATSDLENACHEISLHAQSVTGMNVQVLNSYKALDATIERVERALDGQRGSIQDVLTQQRDEAATWAAAHREQSEQALELQRATTSALADDMATRLENVADQVKHLLQRAEPKLPSPEEWSCLQQTMRRCSDAAQAFAEGAERLGKSSDCAGFAASNEARNLAVQDLERLLQAAAQQVVSGVSATQGSLRNDLQTIGHQVAEARQMLAHIAHLLSRPGLSTPPDRPGSDGYAGALSVTPPPTPQNSFWERILRWWR
jgi:hypothetical protein